MSKFQLTSSNLSYPRPKQKQRLQLESLKSAARVKRHPRVKQQLLSPKRVKVKTLSKPSRSLKHHHLQGGLSHKTLWVKNQWRERLRLRSKNKRARAAILLLKSKATKMQKAKINRPKRPQEGQKQRKPKLHLPPSKPREIERYFRLWDKKKESKKKFKKSLWWQLRKVDAIATR